MKILFVLLYRSRFNSATLRLRIISIRVIGSWKGSGQGQIFTKINCFPSIFLLKLSPNFMCHLTRLFSYSYKLADVGEKKFKILKISIGGRVYNSSYFTGTFFDFAGACFFFKSCTIVSSIFCLCFDLSTPLLCTSTTTDRAAVPLPILTPTAVNCVCNQNESYIGYM